VLERELRIDSGEHVPVSPDSHPDFFHPLVPESLDELRGWIGTPDLPDDLHEIAQVDLVDRTSPPEQFLRNTRWSEEDHQHLASVAHQYLFRSPASVHRDYLKILDTWLTQVITPILYVMFPVDIFVAAGARMLVDPSVPLIVSNAVVVEPGGAIVCSATTRIECTRFTTH